MDRFRHERPHVRVRLQDQRHALDGGGVGALAALGEPIFEQGLRISELGDVPTSGALTAEVVREAFAIRGLREHAREREFSEAARAGEKQRVRDTLAAQSAAERCHNAFVAEKFGKTHFYCSSPAEADESTPSTAARTSAAISSGSRMALRVASKH